MLIEAGLTDPDGLQVVADPPVFLCELGKSNRRRILLDPASKVFDPGVVDHALHYGTTVTATVTEAERPRLSVTVSDTATAPGTA